MVHAREGQQHQNKSRELQRALYRAAKRSRTRRFHALYDRIYRPDVLWRAWEEVRSNKGGSGIDGISISDIETSGVEAFLNGIAEDLKAGIYRPKPVKRVMIPKPDGQKRPLGIPTVRDRVIQQACRIVIEPVFEATFEDCSYGFRPKRSAKQAVREVKESLVRGWWVVDADIEGFFDNISQELLLNLVRRRISDRRVGKLIRKWLKAGAVEDGKYSRTEKGTPQGGVISPLLANIYLHAVDRYWTLECGGIGKLVRYADDIVVICRSRRQAYQALDRLKSILGKLKLRLHPDKTKVVRTEFEGFDFLGFHFHKGVSRRSGKLVPFVWPSSASMKRIRLAIKECLNIRWLKIPLEDVITRLNRLIRGWRNYFEVGNGSRKFVQLDYYVRMRLYRFYRRKLGSRAGQVRERFLRWLSGSGVVPFFRKGVFGRAS